MKTRIAIIGLIVGVVLLGGALVFTLYAGGGQVEIKDTAQLSADELRLQSYVETGHLISATNAANLIANAPDVLVLDIRKGTEYATGRIPGAVNIFRGDYSADEGEYPFGGMRASEEKMEALLSELGVTPETLILAYDGKGNYDAARFWWQLAILGHDYVKLIDGGIQGWQAAGFELSVAAAEARPATEYRFDRPENLSRLATLDDVLSAQNDPNVVLLDTRALSECTGEKLMRGAFREGRIPGAVWIEFKDCLCPAMCFKDIEELRAMYVDAGITPDKTIIAYCQSGVRSAHTTFVLTEILGYPNVKNYDGSWIEYSYHAELPVESGEVRVASN
ncbi:MAG: sulfurtransferase [Spirochaetaceae bacterium]